MTCRIALLVCWIGCALAVPAARPQARPPDLAAAAGESGGAAAGEETTDRVNWALAARAGQSTTRTGHPAGLAVDGRLDGDLRAGTVSLTRREAHPYWEVDLGEVRAIDEVRIHLCQVGCGERLRDVVVFVANEPLRHRDAAASALQLGVKLAIVWGPLGDLREDGERETFQTVRLTAAGRWVRVQRIGAGVLGLAEVELLGPSPAEPGPGHEPALTHPPGEP